MSYIKNNILLPFYCHVRYSADIILSYQQNQELICRTWKTVNSTLEYLLTYS